MRWERLFEDLEAQLRAEELRDLDAEVVDRTRRERALLGLHERFAAQLHRAPVVLKVAGAGVVAGAVTDVGADWVLVEERAGHPGIVPFAALRAVTGLQGRAGPTSAVAKRFALGAALRAVSRDRTPVVVVDRRGERLTGTIDAVGEDAFDLAEHPLELPRRPEHVVALRTVPFSAVGVVRRH